MDEEFKSQLNDYFSASELLELLDEITIDDLCYSFEDLILENEDVLKDYMRDGR